MRLHACTHAHTHTHTHTHTSAVTVARAVMDKSPHNVLVGKVSAPCLPPMHHATGARGHRHGACWDRHPWPQHTQVLCATHS